MIWPMCIHNVPCMFNVVEVWRAFYGLLGADVAMLAACVLGFCDRRVK